ncbi:MAG: tRNA (adenosine(37)-N6)-threonylcarbamoyltransferase complex transferase subunit TsaD [Candidatus Moranbacteria bacterium]|nr:tRNA (adenosine(37)-N6)-threonylcarbamoyltransferase complex transferase subunit TsaD [Candidatus Moranbacteria bacterium]
MKVLSIETSCDETAASVVEYIDSQATVLANTVSSQASLHAKWGGVVPDLASREHIKNIVPVITETLERAKLSPTDIDLIAVTEGPGLMPALVIGVTTAKTLALIWNKPLIGIQHLEGHIYANFISEKSEKLKVKSERKKETFPLVALVVSGGHTELVLMKDHFQYEILGETQDDAAGEAFDKVAKMLGLDYPGGPVVARKADAFRERNFQFPISNFQTSSNDSISNSKKFEFPRPMLDADNFDFSFSGLKTSVLYYLKKHENQKKDEKFIDEVCHEFQEAVVDVLVGKTKKALALYSPATFVIAGGVSANVRLRNQLRNVIETEFPDTDFLTPEFSYSLDNAAMIGIAGALRYEYMSESDRATLMQSHLTLEPNANLPFQNLL